MTRTTPAHAPAHSRRAFLARSVAAIASAALAACGGSTSEPTATAMPPAVPPTPTTATATTTPMPGVAPVPTATNGVGVPSQAVIDVRQFGAAGDGKTDDTAAIQRAIDAAPAGATVLFPPGRYIVAPGRTTGIAIKSNLRLAGAGANSILKIRDRLGDWQRLFSPRDLGGTIENFAVEDLTFDANIASNPESLINEKRDPTYQTFVHITSGRNLSVRRCRFAPYSGVWAVAFVGQQIDNCAVTDSYFQFVMRDGNPDYDNSAVYVEGTNYLFSGNTFESTPTPNRGARACMETHGGPAEVFNNTSKGYQTLLNIVGSYYKGGSAGDITCHDNTCIDALQAIMLWPTLPNNLKNVTVAHNAIAIAQTKHGAVDTSGVSVLFSPEAKGLAADITIARNTIRFEDEGTGRAGDFYYNSSGIGLHNLGGVSGCVIDGNTIELAPSAGIAIGLPEPGKRSFDNVKVTNNTIVNPGQNLAFPPSFRSGVLVNSTATNIEIRGNRISDTFPTPRCPSAISFDQARGNIYTGITVSNNVVSANGKELPLLLPKGAVQ